MAQQRAASSELDWRDRMPLWLRAAIAGAGSGMTTKTCVAPLERVKILLQIQAMKGYSGESAKYRGVLGTVRTVVREESAAALWRGNMTNCVRVVPVYALKFSLNDKFKAMILRPGQDASRMDFGQLIKSGTMAGAFQMSATYPLEVVRSRLSVGPALGITYGGIVDCARKTVKLEGIGGLYRGYMVGLTTGAPYVGLQMTFYDILKRQMPKREDGSTAVVFKLATGAVAGVAAQTIVYPGDLVRRRLHLNGQGGEARTYEGPIDCVRQIWRKEGPAAFFKGCGANCIRAIPGAAIQFAAYDFLKDVLRCG